jgi:WD repeat-containing protein 48
MDSVITQVNTVETVAPWCSVDTRTGCLTCALEEYNCFDAELYADDMEIEEDIEFKEDQRINLGKWVLRYLFDNLINEEVHRDETFRQKLFASKYPNFAMEKRPVPGTIALPPPPQLTSWFDPSSAPTSASTLKPTNGFHFPQTPGLGIGVATPGPAPLIPKINSPLLSPDDANTDAASRRNSTERQSGDYFSNRPTSGAVGLATATSHPNGRTSQEGNNLLQTPTNVDAEATTPSPEKSGIKKFMRMGFISKTLKKVDKSEAKQPGPEDLQSDSDSRNSRADERLMEDSFLGSILRLRHAYEELNNGQPSEKDVMMGLSKKDSTPPASVPTAITPSLPSDTPVLKPPPQTGIIIQEDSADSGGVADLWEGTVGSVGREADLVERVAPSWLADVLLKNLIPQKEIVKISFILEPLHGLLPPVSTDGNTRLNANRMLRARKIMVYVAERIESLPEKPEPDALKPEDYLELYCHDQVRLPSCHFHANRTAHPSNHDFGDHQSPRLARRWRCHLVLQGQRPQIDTRSYSAKSINGRCDCSITMSMLLCHATHVLYTTIQALRLIYVSIFYFSSSRPPRAFHAH